MLCNHLSPKLKGRPRGRRKKFRSDSPGSRLRFDSAGSDSGTSEISACSIEKVYSKYSPLYVKPEFKQGKQVLATRPNLRYNPRPARTKARSESSVNSCTTSKLRLRPHLSFSQCVNPDESDSISDSYDNSDSNTNTTNRDDDANDSSEECEFMQKLIDFHEAQHSHISKVFWMSLKRINLLSIYRKVKKMGGYETINEHKMWKYLFDGGYNSISRKKYERVLLPFEKYEIEQQLSQQIRHGRNTDHNIKFEQGKSSDENLRIKGLKEGVRRLTTSNGSPPNGKIIDPTVHLEMAQNSLPVTVILGGPSNNLKKSSSPQHIKIQQPHTTITVHQTTIHPQSLQMPTNLFARTSQNTNDSQQQSITITNQIKIQQITMQPQASTSAKNDPLFATKLYNYKQKSSTQDVNISINRQLPSDNVPSLFKSTTLRSVRMKQNQSKNQSIERKSVKTVSDIASPIIGGSVNVSAVKPNEKENIPYLSGSKTTTITPVLKNSNKATTRLPSLISEVIDLVDSDNSRSPSPHRDTATVFPNMKKRTLDILRQGGLEVTAINNALGPLNHPNSNTSSNTSSTTSYQISTIRSNSTIKQPRLNSHAISITLTTPAIPMPQFQSKCMYTKTSRIFGNPKDLIPTPSSKCDDSCLDLTIQRNFTDYCSPQSTTQKIHSTTTNVSSTTLVGQKIIDPNLQITLVPSLGQKRNTQTFQHYNLKRKVFDTNLSTGEPSEKKAMYNSAVSHTSESNSYKQRPLTTVTSLPKQTSTSLINVPKNDLKVNQLLLQKLKNQDPTPGTPTQLSTQINQTQNDTKTEQNQKSTELSSATSAANPFLSMLDPILLSTVYNNPNLYLPQIIPQDLLQWFKDFPQGFGIVPISKN